ncbi:MAG: hypothetical protein HY692_00620, partial [Cyanobacteria bacterium NC_groundwater_1444_Ag_S-0.65um_54_12]|nr:hypothetical protein [Cyanobacteria bacterium NC_groundwater_1444_Ag_S-0.65um_54_12]
INTDQLAATCKLPASALTFWETATAERSKEPIFGPDGEPLATQDPTWLRRFTQASLEAKFFFGPIHEIPGSGPEVLAALIRQTIKECATAAVDRE